MIHNKFNILFDVLWGSSGKGKFAVELHQRFGSMGASTCNQPNAGHTSLVDGRRIVLKACPSGGLVSAAGAFLGPTSVFNKHILEDERLLMCGPTHIHPRAVLTTREDCEQEQQKLAHVAGTFQGSWAAAARKGWREPDAIYSHMPTTHWKAAFDLVLRTRGILHEVAQGMALSLDWGNDYPKCTSRNCTPQQAAADMLVRPCDVGDVYGIIRTYPIRVGNHNGVNSGNAGVETTWGVIEERAGAPGGTFSANEYTTVTKRQRRVFELDIKYAARLANLAGTTKLILNFVQYVDYAAHGITEWNKLSRGVLDLVAAIEDEANIRVVACGTGETTTAWRER